MCWPARPGMALMFLMFTVSYGGRSLLVEEATGTLPRLLVSPTTVTQILAGKIFGIFPHRGGATAHSHRRHHAHVPPATGATRSPSS